MSKDADVYSEKCWKVKGVYGDLTCERLDEFVHCRNCPEFKRLGRKLFNTNTVSKELLSEWTDIHSRVKKKEKVGDFSIVPFRLRNEWFALPTKLLVGASEVLPIHSVPHRTNNVFLGLVNMTGELLCCMSAYEVLGLNSLEKEDEKDVYKRMLVIKKENDVFVFKVDELIRATKISSDNLKKPPATLAKSLMAYTKDIYEDKDKRISIINDENFFKTLRESLNTG